MNSFFVSFVILICSCPSVRLYFGFLCGNPGVRRISASIMSMCSFSVENNGFEPLTPCLQSRCSSQLS